jgi:hypothetical protein
MRFTIANLMLLTALVGALIVSARSLVLAAVIVEPSVSLGHVRSSLWAMGVLLVLALVPLAWRAAWRGHR